ncbi:MAG: YcgN family cysteine cluster protein [Halioglobus sp.]
MADWWHTKTLAELDSGEWEALCDGCAKCCLHKFEDEGSGQLLHTRVHCRLLVESTCRCADYEKRAALVPDCVDLRTAGASSFQWLPGTCAYRLRSQGQPLPSWHHLLSGSAESVHSAGISIRGRTVSEEYVHPDGYDEHIVTWVE